MGTFLGDPNISTRYEANKEYLLLYLFSIRFYEVLLLDLYLAHLYSKKN